MPKRLSRRDFLNVTGFSALAASMWAFRGAVPEIVPPGADDDLFIFRALQRATFGARPEDVKRVKSIGWEAFVREQCKPTGSPGGEVEKRLAAFQTLQMNAKQLTGVDPSNLGAIEMIRAMILHSIYSKRQVYEQMVHFWNDHFSIYIHKKDEQYLKPVDDREVIRAFAMGKFSKLLMASAKSPAMLVYLDNGSNTKDIPNENYARELLELHTMSPAGGYTQKDVEETARALTGWTTGMKEGKNFGDFLFKSEKHDFEEKTILGVKYPKGVGVREGEQLIEMLAAHPATGSFLVTKLCQRFVSESVKPALLVSASKVFGESKGNMASVMQDILLSEDFRASLGTKTRRPYDFVTAALCLTGAEVEVTRALTNALFFMGHQPFGRQTPDGFPEAGSAWLNSNDLLARWNFAFDLASGSLNGVQIYWHGVANYAESIESALDNLSLRLLGGYLPAETRAMFLKNISGLRKDQAEALAGALIIASPHFQYR